MQKEKIALGMSGGVDSSVAAYLLKEKGYEVIGITMKLIDDEKAAKSIEDAKRVCQELNIKHYTIDLVKEFRQIVINNFIETYKNGKTPNPCVVCNKYFKFGLFYEKAKELGINKIATGHYAKIEHGKLKVAEAIEKDQSYFLYGIKKEILENTEFPLADYQEKDKIREIASKLNLSTKEKKDSQEICFVPNDDYTNLLRNNIAEEQKVGDICLENGTILGKHNGLINYTIGQRKGLGISYNEPLYVIEIDKENNKIIVGPNNKLYHDTLIATDINILSNDFNQPVYAKIRSRSLREEAVATIKDNKLIVKFKNKQRAITKGQSVVIYDKDGFCLGGGIIEEIQ